MSSSSALDTFMDGAIKSFLENPSVESAQLIVGMANTIRENTAPLPCSGGCCPDGEDMHHEPASPTDSDTDDGEETHGGEMPFYGYEEFPHDYADDGMNDDGEAIHDSDEEMYDSDGDDADAGHSEVVPMSGVDTGMNECQLSNIHGYKHPYLPMSRYGLVMGEGVLPSGVGCSWLPGEEERNTEWSQCACVRAEKIQLVVAKTPHELCQEHCSGEWCPCPGMQKKWIYRHFGTLDVSHFERHASKELIDMWQLARRVADPDGWVQYGTIREYFSLENYHSQSQSFYKLRDVWNILTASDIPENSTSMFQLKPQFR